MVHYRHRYSWHPYVRSHDELSPTTRALVSFAHFLGTPKYLLWQTVVVIAWVALNMIAIEARWDPYPFILLNLVFSTQAAYAAPIILYSQNRASEEREQITRKQDEDICAMTVAHEKLQAKLDRALELLEAKK